MTDLMTPPPESQPMTIDGNDITDAELNGATITDEQVCELIDLGNEILRIAHAALDTSISGRKARAEARTRCAQLLAARKAAR